MNKTPFKKAILNLPFVNFEETPEYVGMYRNTITLGESEPFDANVFADVETGEEKFVTDSYSIKKAIKAAKAEYAENFSDIVFQIVFEGKTMLNGKPFNKFDIGYCTLEEYQSFFNDKPKVKK